MNHPNFGYAVTAEDLAAVTDEQFYEVYNGHPGVNHLGDKDHPSVEAIWDQVNVIRLSAGAPPLMGIATDDSHEYHGLPGSRPGRGWVMVNGERWQCRSDHALTPGQRVRIQRHQGFTVDVVPE